MPQSNKVAERLLAHARLYRKIAHAGWNEETAAQARLKADNCVRDAVGADDEKASEKN